MGTACRPGGNRRTLARRDPRGHSRREQAPNGGRREGFGGDEAPLFGEGLGVFRWIGLGEETPVARTLFFLIYLAIKRCHLMWSAEFLSFNSLSIFGICLFGIIGGAELEGSI